MDPLTALWDHRSYLMIIPVLSLLMLVHELGHFVTARLARMKVEEFGFGFPPRLAGKEIGGVVYSLNWIPLGAFVRILGEDDPKEPDSFASKSPLARFIVLFAGSGMNFVLAVALFAAAYLSGVPTPTLMRIEVGSVLPDSPAQAAGLRAGDVLLAVNDQPVPTIEVLQRLARANAGREIVVRVQRDGQELALPVTPRPPGVAGSGTIGVSLHGTVLEAQPLRYDPGAALAHGVEQTWRLVTLTLSLPVLLVQGAITPDQARPIGIVNMGRLVGDAASTVGETGLLFPLLMLTAAFSAGLGVVNLLPLPGLDGGRLLFLVIETVRGQRIAPERAELVHAVGIALLLALMGVLIVSDLVSPAPPIDWGVPR
ncbi:MAG TPA: M50 family metallopeptidase [Chloroflexota bacterium]|jgi:regulator of sigma E protease|nr:M50 family metallopeptidase [Chloroflexota bacterium]